MESELMQYLTQGGAIGVLAVIVLLFITGWIISKRTYDKATETFKESLNQIIESDKDGRQELMDLLKSINGRSKKK